MVRGLVAVLLMSTLLLRSAPCFADCSSDSECKGDRICVDGACRSPDAGRADARPPKVKKRFVSPGLFYGGIVVAALTPIALAVALYSNFEKSTCEGDARFRAFGTSQAPNYDSCSSYGPTIAASLVVAGITAVSGTVMIVLGAKREPVTKQPDAAFRVAPWAEQGGGGMSLRWRF